MNKVFENIQMYVWPPVPKDPCKTCIIKACCIERNCSSLTPLWKRRCEDHYKYEVNSWKTIRAKNARFDTITVITVITVMVIGMIICPHI